LAEHTGEVESPPFPGNGVGHHLSKPQGGPSA
jgi:hypothetical protein